MAAASAPSETASAATRASLYEASFIPNAGYDLGAIKASRLHEGLLRPQHPEASSAAHDDGDAPAPAPAAATPITMSYVDRARYGDRAVLLHNVLTPDECSQLIELCGLVGMCDASPDKRYRNNMRCEVSSIPLARALFDRIRPFIADAEQIVTAANCEAYPQNTLMIGDWRLEGANDHFRLCFYEPGGHFGPHYDGEYNPDPNVCSIKTLMLYLNDDYAGGATNFVSEHALHFDEALNIYRSPAGAVVASVKAARGDALIFDHKILHEGGIVDSGRKFIIRSELMYRRADRMTAAEKAGRALLAEARFHEGCKDGDNAVRCYRAAFRICPELEACA